MLRKTAKELMSTICATHKAEELCNQVCTCCPMNSNSVKAIKALKDGVEAILEIN
jgi:hypothetical protein